jgi:hypothetical protein
MANKAAAIPPSTPLSPCRSTRHPAALVGRPGATGLRETATSPASANGRPQLSHNRSRSGATGFPQLTQIRDAMPNLPPCLSLIAPRAARAAGRLGGSAPARRTGPTHCRTLQTPGLRRARSTCHRSATRRATCQPSGSEASAAVQACVRAPSGAMAEYYSCRQH